MPLPRSVLSQTAAPYAHRTTLSPVPPAIRPPTFHRGRANREPPHLPHLPMASPSLAPSSTPRAATEWTAKEEDLVIHHTRTHGLGRWDEVGALLPARRTGVATYGHWISCDLWMYADRDVPGALDQGMGWDPREDADLVKNVLKLGESGKWGKVSEKLETVRTPQSCEARWFQVMKPIHIPLPPNPKPKPKSTPRARPASSSSNDPPPAVRAQSRRTPSHRSSSDIISPTGGAKRPRSFSPDAPLKKSRSETAEPMPPSTPGAKRISPSLHRHEGREVATQISVVERVDAASGSTLLRGRDVGTQISLPRVAGLATRTESRGDRVERDKEIDRLWEVAKDGMLQFIASWAEA